MTTPIVKFGPTLRYLVVAVVVNARGPLTLDGIAEALADEGWYYDLSRIADAVLGELASEIPIVEDLGGHYVTVNTEGGDS